MHFTSSADMSQDLGRHIKIGEIIVSQKSIPATNLFSYTNPDFPFINHHWLSEVLFYTLATFTGLPFLILLKVTVFIGAIGVLIRLGYQLKSPLITIITAILFAPLFLERSTIRPEMFGYLFFALLLYGFFQYPKRRNLLSTFPVIMLVWINLHISFIFGFVIVGLLIIKILMNIYTESKGSKISLTAHIKRDLSLLIGSVLITILNPHGIFGLLYPLNIFNNYGYTIVENQNIFFLNSLMVNPHIRYLFLLSPVIIGSLFVLFFNKKILEGILLTLFSAAVIMQVRHMPFAALVCIPTVSLSAAILLKKFKLQEKQTILISALLTVFCFGISMFFMQNLYSQTFDLSKSFGLEVKEDAKNATDFVLSHNLPGQIFNNFDIGGYAIYKLYPRYKVFVDNRPEAYPKEFLENVYIKLQVDPTTRRAVFKKYNIKTIYFSHTDQTYWANAFIENIVSDPDWRIVYLDDTIIVLTTDKQYADIRSDEKNLTRLLTKETGYVSLIKLNHIFSLLKEDALQQAAFAKAQEINPASCAINKNLYYRYASSPQLQKALEIKSSFWYCF